MFSLGTRRKVILRNDFPSVSTFILFTSAGATVFRCIYHRWPDTRNLYRHRSPDRSIVRRKHLYRHVTHETQHEVRRCRSAARVGGHGRRRLVGAREEGRRVEEQQRTVRVRGRVQDGQEDDRLR